MKLYQMVAKDILRRKKCLLYAILGVTIGTMTVISILTIALAGQSRIYDQLEKYGANLVVPPVINNIDMEFGGLSLGVLMVGENYIDEDKVNQTRQLTDIITNPIYEGTTMAILCEKIICAMRFQREAGPGCEISNQFL